MKKYFILAVLIMITGWSTAQNHNTLTIKEKWDGWKLLFDGKTTAGWHDYGKKSVSPAWKVSNGELWLDPKASNVADILTDGEFENFELRLEWKIDSCGNSGIIFNSVESAAYKHAYDTGPEMQILDNACHPDRMFPKHRAGNLYDLIASPVESVKPALQWNSVKIESNKGHLVLWLNEVKQAETTMFTPEWEALVKRSKFNGMLQGTNSLEYPDFGKFRKGHIMLQEHGSRVWFRNIKIREL